MPTFWDERFDTEEYIYGESPNAFLASVLPKMEKGNILFPGEGEGRNAVYAARLGWDVSAFDSSIVGKEKSLKLADKKGVSIKYEISDYQSFNTKEKYDVVALFFTHLPSEFRSEVHKKYTSMLKPGGQIIAQWFRKEQLGLETGGPKNIDMLFSKAELTKDFAALSECNISEVDETLSEGPYHQGLAHLINLIGRK